MVVAKISSGDFYVLKYMNYFIYNKFIPFFSVFKRKKININIVTSIVNRSKTNKFLLRFKH